MCGAVEEWQGVEADMSGVELEEMHASSGKVPRCRVVCVQLSCAAAYHWQEAVMERVGYGIRACVCGRRTQGST